MIDSAQLKRLLLGAAALLLVTAAGSLALALLLVKLALYAGALYLGVARKLADPVGVFAGMTVVAAVLVVGVLWKGSAPAKEVS